MGLDVRAYRRVTKTVSTHPDPDEVQDGAVRVYVSYDPRGQSDGIQDRRVFIYTEQMHFHAGSYSSYNLWRNQLAQMVGYEFANHRYENGRAGHLYYALLKNTKTGPFLSLIDFSDAEGIIGPNTSSLLYVEFEEWDGEAKRFGDTLRDSAVGGDYSFYGRYQNFKQAFKMAAGTGFVQFS
jgi:hypothetical protein